MKYLNKFIFFSQKFLPTRSLSNKFKKNLRRRFNDEISLNRNRIIRIKELAKPSLSANLYGFLHVFYVAFLVINSCETPTRDIFQTSPRRRSRTLIINGGFKSRGPTELRSEPQKPRFGPSSSYLRFDPVRSSFNIQRSINAEAKIEKYQ